MTWLKSTSRAISRRSLRRSSPRPDIVFNALHGKGGEDGTIQGVLEFLRIPYTHSGVVASAIAMHKPSAKAVFAAAGLPLAESRVVARAELAGGDVLPRPFVVKPVDEGSSVGVRIVRQGDNGWAEEARHWKYGDAALVETYVPGREITVAVMGERALGVLGDPADQRRNVRLRRQVRARRQRSSHAGADSPGRLWRGVEDRAFRASRAQLPGRQPLRPALRRHRRRARPHGAAWNSTPSRG